MLNYAETDSLSTTIPVARVPDPCSREHHFISQMPKHITIGHLTLINDHETFLQGFAAGIESYSELWYEKQEMTAQELLYDLQETIGDRGTPLAWRLGLIVGEIAGMLNPDLADIAADLSCLEGLTRKCQMLYPGPGLISTHLHAIYQATGFELVDVEVIPSSPGHE